MKNVSIICVNENSTLETVALRGVLECFGYLPSVHWIGSVEQFRQLLSEKTSLSKIVVLSSHGCEKGFYCTNNVVVPLEELKINLPGATILSLGCVTGIESFAKEFVRGGANCYVAPPSYPEGDSALVFAVTFLWKLHGGANPLDAWEAASALLTEEDDRFHIYRKITSGMSVDDNREIPL